MVIHIYLTETLIFVFADKFVTLDQVWFVGDNFAARTYRQHFLLRKDHVHNKVPYVKSHFDLQMFCNNRYNSAQENMLIRIQNTVASALNGNVRFPKFLLIILDDDLITFLNYKGTAVAEFLSKWADWLMKAITSLIEIRHKQLPVKSVRAYESCIYLCAVPTHKNFSIDRNLLRRKWNTCLELLCKD